MAGQVDVSGSVTPEASTLTSRDRRRGPDRTPSVLARRLRAAVGTVGVVAAAALLVRHTVLPLLWPEVHPSWRWPTELATGLLVVASLALHRFFAKRGPTLSLAAMDALAIGFLLFLCLVVGMFEVLLVSARSTWGLSWNCVLVVLFAVIAPMPSWRTVVGALLGSLATPAMLGLADYVGNAEPEAFTYVAFVAHALVATTLAGAAAWLVYIRREDILAELGSYHLEERIASGGMGELWRAYHRLLLRPAAVKIVRPELLARRESDVERLMLRFHREALATANLQSPHTVRLLDFGSTDQGQFYLAMELLDGVDLWELVKTHGPVEPERAIHFLRQTCHALKEAHELGLVHRDIKPANLMACRLGPDYDFIKVCDFGLVKWHTLPESREALNVTGREEVPGTPAFLSPEAITGDVEVGPRSDLYSLGCVAYWLLTGRLIFEADTTLQMIVMHVRDEVVPPSSVTEDPIPEGLEALILKCLEKDPADRPASAEALERQLAAIELDEEWTQERAAKWWRLHLPQHERERHARMQSASLRPLSNHNDAA